MQVEEDLQTIRQHAAPTKRMQDEPETETWINQEYAEVRNLENREAHGCEGIPGEAYKSTKKGQSRQKHESRMQ